MNQFTLERETHTKERDALENRTCHNDEHCFFGKENICFRKTRERTETLFFISVYQQDTCSCTSKGSGNFLYTLYNFNERLSKQNYQKSIRFKCSSFKF